MRKFFDLMHVCETSALTLKNEISRLFLVIIFLFKIWAAKDITAPVTCMESGMD